MDNVDASIGTTLLSNVKSKFVNFHPSDLLPNFGFLKRKNKNLVDDCLTKSSQPDEFSVRETRAPTSAFIPDSLNVDGVDSVPACADLSEPLRRRSSVKEVRSNVLSDFANALYQTAQMSAIDNVCNYYHDLFLTEGRPNTDYDTVEIQHFGTFKRLKTLGKRSIGLGHKFDADQLNQPTFCDKCGDLILGLYKQAVRCQICHYVCHYKCESLVTLDCRSSVEDLVESRSRPENDVFIEPESIITSIHASNNNDSFEESWTQIKNVGHLIKEYNAEAEDGLKMTSDGNGCEFSGFVQIYLNLSRPVSIVDGEKPSSIYDVINAEESSLKFALASNVGPQNVEPKTITSFYLPRNTAKILHINRRTTTRQMIAALLKKFKVADNPFKFALYQRDTAPGQTLRTRLRRIADDAFPLVILLQWGSKSNKSFVLQENDTGDIIWDYFEIPELENFLKVLEKEEQQYIAQIRRKYEAYRFYIRSELMDRGEAVTYANDATLDEGRPKYMNDELSTEKPVANSGTKDKFDTALSFTL